MHYLLCIDIIMQYLLYIDIKMHYLLCIDIIMQYLLYVRWHHAVSTLYEITS